ncbi:Cytochrome C' [compost metagenome]
MAESERSSAKPEVWQDQQRFQQLARELEAATAALRTASAQQPLTTQAVAPLVQRVEDSCETCHKAFRAY